MSLSGHVHHFALVISIYDLVIFIDVSVSSVDQTAFCGSLTPDIINVAYWAQAALRRAPMRMSFRIRCCRRRCWSIMLVFGFIDDDVINTKYFKPSRTQPRHQQIGKPVKVELLALSAVAVQALRFNQHNGGIITTINIWGKVEPLEEFKSVLSGCLVCPLECLGVYHPATIPPKQLTGATNHKGIW